MRIADSRKGMTMVEVIAALALTGMVMAATSAAFGFCMRMSLRIEASARAERVGEGLLDVIADAVRMDGLPESEEEFLSERIEEALYRGFSVEQLSFTRVEPEKHPDVLRIDLILCEERTGISFKASDYVRLYEAYMPEEDDIPLLDDIPR